MMACIPEIVIRVAPAKRPNDVLTSTFNLEALQDLQALVGMDVLNKLIKACQYYCDALYAETYEGVEMPEDVQDIGLNLPDGMTVTTRLYGNEISWSFNKSTESKL